MLGPLFNMPGSTSSLHRNKTITVCLSSGDFLAGTTAGRQLHHGVRPAHRQSAVDAARLYRRLGELHVPTRQVSPCFNHIACTSRWVYFDGNKLNVIFWFNNTVQVHLATFYVRFQLGRMVPCTDQWKERIRHFFLSYVLGLPLRK